MKIGLLKKVFLLLVASAVLILTTSIHFTYRSEAKKMKHSYVNTELIHTRKDKSKMQNLKLYFTPLKVSTNTTTLSNIGLGVSRDLNSSLNPQHNKTFFQQFGLGNLNMTTKMQHERPDFNFSMIPTRVLRNFSSEKYKKEPRWSMVVAIKSAYKRSNERELIRQTWGAVRFLKGVRLEVIFAVGTPSNTENVNDTFLQVEQSKHEDILQVNVAETYQKMKHSHVNTELVQTRKNQSQIKFESENKTNLQPERSTLKIYLTNSKVSTNTTTIGLDVSQDLKSTMNPQYIKSSFQKFGLGNLIMTTKMKKERPDFKFSITPTRVLRNFSSEKYKKGHRWSMVVAIKSAYKRSNERELIRQTWGAVRFLKGVRLEVIFVVGTPSDSENVNNTFLQFEQSKNEDILQVNVPETYQNVGLKALAAMQWVGRNLPNDWIYSSTDDDIFPKLPDLFDGIENVAKEIGNSTLGNRKTYFPIYCAFDLRLKDEPMRGQSTWSVDIATYPLNLYPPFCLGGFYSMPVTITSEIFKISKQYPYFRMDDVWITGFLRLFFCDSLDDDTRYQRTDVMCALSNYHGGYAMHFGSNINKRKYLKMWETERKQIMNYDVEFAKG